jgi:hypothetical protein
MLFTTTSGSTYVLKELSASDYIVKGKHKADGFCFLSHPQV